MHPHSCFVCIQLITLGYSKTWAHSLDPSHVEENVVGLRRTRGARICKSKCISSMQSTQLTLQEVAFIAFRQMLLARHLEHKILDLTKHLLPKSSSKTPHSKWRVLLPSRPKMKTPSIPADEQGRHHSGIDARPCMNTSLKIPSPYRFNTWTRVHSHFALMGGFVLETQGRHRPILDSGDFRLTLTPVALRMIAENAPELLPDLSEPEIEDKSKANGLAKFLVCIQAAWFIVQTLGRLVTGYPISLLEMNTLLHAFCCLFIYLAWWHKPLDIDEPHVTSTAGNDVAKICAWMLTKDDQHRYVDSFEDCSNGRATPSASTRLRLAYAEDLELGHRPFDVEGPSRDEMCKQVASSLELNRHRGRAEDIAPDNFDIQHDSSRKATGNPCLKVYPGQKVYGFVVYATTDPKAREVYACLPLPYIKGLHSAQSLREEGRAWCFRNQWLLDDPKDRMLTRGTTFVHLYSPNKSPMTPGGSKTLWIFFFLFSTLYGGLHLLAWDAPFSNKTERLLWRMSALVVTSAYSGLFAGSIFTLLVLLSRFPSAVKGGRWKRWVKTAIEYFTTLILFAGVAGYVLARLYLFVECFINLAHLPDDVFKEAQWIDHFPHFGAG
jgi:hypothetical protein